MALNKPTVTKELLDCHYRSISGPEETRELFSLSPEVGKSSNIVFWMPDSRLEWVFLQDSSFEIIYSFNWIGTDRGVAGAKECDFLCLHLHML